MPIEDAHKKLIMNAYIGMLGRTETENYNYSLSNDADINISLFIDNKISQVAAVVPNSNLYLLGSVETIPASSHCRNIWCDVVIDGVFQLYDMYKKLMAPNSILISYNTDCLTIANAKSIEIPESNFSIDKVGAIHAEKVKLLAKREKIREPRATVQVYANEWQDVSEYESDNKIKMSVIDNLIADRKSFRIQASAGRGKTHLCGEKFKDLPHIALGLTNQVRITLQSFGLCAKTLAAFFNKHPDESEEKHLQKLQNLVRDKYVIIDEVTMITPGMLTQLYALWRRCRFSVVIVGDFKQLPPPVAGNYADNCNLYIVKEMCEYRMITLKYNYRSNAKLDNVCNSVYARKQITTQPFKSIDRLLPISFCFTRARRDEINKKCVDEFGNGKVIDDLGLFAGCPLRVVKNSFSEGLFNGDFVTYDGCDNENVYYLDCENIRHPSLKKDFKVTFMVGYCSTIHSTQCRTINEPFNIYECDKFTNQMAYTAFTRATDISLIHADAWRSVFRPAVYAKRTFDITESLTKIAIYVLRNEDGIFYVGKTNCCERRFAQHTESAKSDPEPVYEYIRNCAKCKFTFIPIRFVADDNADAAEASTIKEFVRSGIILTNIVYNKVAKPPAPSPTPVLELTLKGSILFQQSSNRWVFRVIVNGKTIQYLAKLTKSRNSDQAKKMCLEAQKAYSLYGEDYRNYMAPTGA